MYKGSMVLHTLKIDSFAIIDNITVYFEPGFTTITGETGAGKSIIIDALNLALGEKASPTMIRSGSESAYIECIFTGIDKSHPVIQFIKDNQLPIVPGRLTLRRQLYVNGRSKAWINDSPCTINLLKSAGDLLVDLHGQHDHQSLLREESHIQFLDAYGGYWDLLEDVHNYYLKLSHLSEKYKFMTEKRSLNREKRELWEFQLNEIEKIDPKEDEYEQLIKEKAVLENSEKIHQIADELTKQLYEAEDDTLYRKVLTIIKKLSILNGIDPEFTGELNKLEETQFLIQDLSNHLSTYTENIQFDSARMETVNQRLYHLQQLMKKYGKAIAEVIEYGEKVKHYLNEDDGIDAEIVKVEKEIDSVRKEYGTVAMELSRQRKKCAESFEKQVDRTLSRLGISGSKFKVSIRYIDAADGWVDLDGRKVKGESDGIDNIVFEISTNPGEPLRPLASIVSGGEVSRIMLAMKSILAGKDHIPVVIFDEIDTGISGKVAQVVGKELKSLADVHQVICITHLPQIAGLGDHHYRVYKVSDDGRSYTKISKLNEMQRVEEIATLIGGASITDTALQQARELLISG
ncbi:MAG: DNA repair protein RecN [Candidatus Marinimicrobia bacterium]|nr:DNA repair protein RecN [Candidatus Neomarinimicrobiota bacterium]